MTILLLIFGHDILVTTDISDVAGYRTPPPRWSVDGEAPSLHSGDSRLAPYGSGGAQRSSGYSAAVPRVCHNHINPSTGRITGT